MSVHRFLLLCLAAVLALIGTAGLVAHIILAGGMGLLGHTVLAVAAVLAGIAAGAVGTALDRRHQLAIQRHNEELSALYAIAITASRSLELSPLLTDTLRQTLDAMHADSGAILLVGDSRVDLAAHQGLGADLLWMLSQPVTREHLLSLVVAADDAVVLDSLPGSFKGDCVSSPVAVAPLRAEGRIIGALCLFSRQPRSFTQPELQILVSIADVVGIAVQNAKLHAQVKENAARDPLTGLYNRRRFDEIYAQELARSSRYATPLTVAMIDINNFKEINDRFGHSVGDQALAAVGRILQSGRASDIAARYGGDEFVVLMPNTDRRAARFVADRIRRLAKATTIPGALDHGIDLSIGLADSMEGYDRILERADARMYQDKRGSHAVDDA